MRTAKLSIIMTGILVTMFIIIGCSSNPMTSTQTIPVVQDNSPDNEATNTEAVDNAGGTPAGYPADAPDYPPDKYDQGDDNVEAPGYPN